MTEEYLGNGITRYTLPSGKRVDLSEEDILAIQQIVVYIDDIHTVANGLNDERE